MAPKTKAAPGAAAAAKPSAGAAKASTGAASVPKPTAAASAGVVAAAFASVDEMKKFVSKHEVKINDLEEEIRNEPNAQARKEQEKKLKKLQKDETYVKALTDITDAEAQAAREAERAALSTKATDKKVGSKANVEKVDKPVAAVEKANAEIMIEIDAAFAASGKDAAVAKEKAVSRMMGCAASTPFVLPRLSKLISLFDNSKLAAPAAKAALAILENAMPKGHGVAYVALPLVLEGMVDKKWKIKAGCIELLVPCLKQMESTPAQLAASLPLIVPKLAEAALEVRAEIRTATSAVLREIGNLVASPEIKKLSQDLVTALAEPTNQKHTQAVLAKMGSQTFLSLIDPASLSLLMPVLLRGLKERDSMSKKWSAQIFGATAMLVQDVDSIRPYLNSMIPLLQQALTDPVPEVQREGAKVYGVLEQVLPEYSCHSNQPWLFGKLRHAELGEQLGAALAIAEVFSKMDKTSAEKLIPEIEVAAQDENPRIRRGFLELLDTMPHAMKMDFVPYITRLFPRMLMGITGDSDKDEDAGLKAATSLVLRFGDLCPQLLLPGFEAVFAATLNGDSEEEHNRHQIVRDRTAMLLGKLADKILEHKKFGQDLLTTDDCSNKETREQVLVVISIMRYDADASVKRYANGAWKTAGGAPKLQKTIMPAIEKMIRRMRAGELGLGMQKLASKIIENLSKSGEIEAPTGDDPETVAPFVLRMPADRDSTSEAASIAAGKVTADPTEIASFARLVSGGAAVQEFLASHTAFSSCPEDILAHCNAVVASVIKEGLKRKSSGPKIASQIVGQLEAVREHLEGDNSSVDLAPVAEAVARACMGAAFDVTGGAGDDDSEILLRVEGLLLMYGGGKLLLKDTVLEMRKSCCYGVVGQNGAGKTTLMKEIANHRIVGMPQELKCVHVDDSKLGLMSSSSLNIIEYSIKMAKDINVDISMDGAKATLSKVGIDESKFEEPVAEMSTGWRMRLTLAVSMLKHADLVLLDEPTNHLDEQSVEWLGEYINSIAGASVMVISHEPKFLNRICTHILAYVDKKLECTAGDFEAFAASKGLTKEQIDAMLSGNLSFDTKKKEDEEEDGADGAPKVEQVAGPSKLSFPIPGSVEGVKSGSRNVLEAKNLSFRYSSDKDYLIFNANVKLSLNSRVAICGRNGCGKSTFMTLLCSAMSPSENKDGTIGEVSRHCNVRMAYMKQDHLTALGPFFETSSFNYISSRFKDGYDGDLQRRLCDPENEEEAERRKRLAKELGKYGNEVEDLVSRTKVGSQLAYEVKWKGLDDPKQNTVEPISKLVSMGLAKVVIACDERIAAKAAGLDQRPLTRREIVRHCEAFGIDEEMCCNQQIKGFSSGQKVRLSLAAMFWTKPHVIALDEPTNYLDVETVEALAKALTNFRGGLFMIEPKTDFVEKICNEKWHLEDGTVTVEKLSNGVRRAA
jgi:ATPase subunit of ABC transporter with duplicated ATPase domains